MFLIKFKYKKCYFLIKYDFTSYYNKDEGQKTG